MSDSSRQVATRATAGAVAHPESRRRPYERPRLRRHGDLRGQVLGGSPGPSESGGPLNTREL